MAWEPNKPLVIEEIEVAPPQANEVRIKVREDRYQKTHYVNTQYATLSFTRRIVVLTYCIVIYHLVFLITSMFDIKGALCNFGDDVLTQNFNSCYINEVII